MTAPSRIPFLFLGTSIFNTVVDEEWMLTMLLKISMSVGSMPFEEKEASSICIYVQVDVSCQERMIGGGPFILAMRASSWSQNLRVRRESFYGRCCKWWNVSGLRANKEKKNIPIRFDVFGQGWNLSEKNHFGYARRTLSSGRSGSEEHKRGLDSINHVARPGTTSRYNERSVSLTVVSPMCRVIWFGWRWSVSWNSLRMPITGKDPLCRVRTTPETDCSSPTLHGRKLPFSWILSSARFEQDGISYCMHDLRPSSTLVWTSSLWFAHFKMRTALDSRTLKCMAGINV
jgi:hypothetical protein